MRLVLLVAILAKVRYSLHTLQGLQCLQGTIDFSEGLVDTVDLAGSEASCMHYGPSCKLDDSTPYYMIGHNQKAFANLVSRSDARDETQVMNVLPETTVHGSNSVSATIMRRKQFLAPQGFYL